MVRKPPLEYEVITYSLPSPKLKPPLSIGTNATDNNLFPYTPCLTTSVQFFQITDSQQGFYNSALIVGLPFLFIDALSS